MKAIPLKARVDLNADMGEGFGPWRMGDDDAIMKIVTSANIACGFHAGDPDIMARSFDAAKRLGVNAGAHPGYPDLSGFGRRPMGFSPAAIERLMSYQIGAALALSRHVGNPITYVKAHGALAHAGEANRETAQAMCAAIKSAAPDLVCMAIAGGLLHEVALQMGLRVCSEIYADRGYNNDGKLIPRGQPGDLITDSTFAAERALRMLRGGGIEAVDGSLVPVSIDSICVHGDSAHAVETATQIRQQLEGAGIAVQSFMAHADA